MFALNVVQPAEVANLIKAKEMETSKPGRFFLSRRNGVLKMVKLTIVNDLLIVDGRELFDFSGLEIVTKG